MQTFEEWLASNAPAATKSEKALARRAWDATHQAPSPSPKKSPKKKRVTRLDGEG